MGGKGFVGTRRSQGLLAAGAAVLLLAGCGGGGEDAKAAALDNGQVASVLPDAKAVPGWRNHMKPEAQKPVPEYPPSVCVARTKEQRKTACDPVTSWGVSAFSRKADMTTLNFWALAYKDEKAADAAYDILAEWYGGDRVGQNAEKVDLGSPGAEREANRAAVGTMAGPATIAQIRVGTTVLGISTGTTGKAVVPDKEVKAFAAMFAERAQQAQNGEKPTAALPGQ
ncbi:hypothetical protein OH786_17880 [Streptomyces atratus]|uniref:PknH-like extracellular domain-containing protein n=1 Tax=Streptomyces atratus TaxID=1893 RepID=A0A1K2E567_STRAR|nr:hypothetical protein [Streptomyces atratus]SFY30036.1 hypothetical protein SAMN02787144_101724 [Streptomyces atratus]